MSQIKSGHLIITGGNFNRKKLHMPPTSITRPTSGKSRQAIFSVLEARTDLFDGQYQNIKALDLFAGSGILGFETISRLGNVAKITFVDKNNDVTNIIKNNLKLLKAESNSNVYNDDSINFIKKLGDRINEFDLIFMDPPYHSDLVDRSLEIISVNAHNKQIIIIEIDKRDHITLPNNIQPITKDRDFGKSKIMFCIVE